MEGVELINSEITDEITDLETAKSPSFEVLVERFRTRVNMIPEDCHQAIYLWHIARRAQEVRIALENRVGQTVKVGRKVFYIDGVPEEIRRAYFERPDIIAKVRDVEASYVKDLKREFKKTRWYNEVAIPAAEEFGMGALLAGDFLWAIGDAKRFSSFGKLVRYAGLDVVDGRAPRRRKGQKINHNPLLRKALYKLTEVWNKRPNCTWRARWDAYKVFYREKFPEKEQYIEAGKKKTRYNDGHIHNMARRKVQREFLRNLYGLWIDFE